MQTTGYVLQQYEPTKRTRFCKQLPLAVIHRIKARGLLVVASKSNGKASRAGKGGVDCGCSVPWRLYGSPVTMLSTVLSSSRPHIFITSRGGG